MSGKPLPLVAQIGARYESLTVDSKLVNCIAEQGAAEGQYYVYKRPGFVEFTNVGFAPSYGCYYWNGFFYYVFATTLYKLSPPPYTITALGTVDASGPYSFSAVLGANPRLVLSNGVRAFTVNAADTIVEITSAITGQPGFPSPARWVPSIVTIDGYVTLADYKSNIWTSTLNTPETWPGNVGIAQIEPDAPVALYKQISYLLCIKQFYTEAFYDAATTPWPYGRVDGAKMNYGCIDGRTVCDVGGDVIWISQTREGGVGAVLVSSMRASVISTPPIERILRGADYTGPVYAWAVKLEGHRLYGVTIVNSNITLVYDLTSKLWYQWTDAYGNYLPYSYASIGTKNEVIFQHESSGSLLIPKVDRYSDSNVPFPVEIYTPNFDGGTRRVKALTKLSIFGDQAQASNVQLFYSDDDYQTWVDAGQVDLSIDDPFWADLGSFKKRAFHFRHQADTPFRVEKIELIVAPGSL